MSVQLNISGVEQLYRNIDKAVKWSTKDSENLQKVGHRVGDVYAGYIKANVKDLGKEKGEGSDVNSLLKVGKFYRSAHNKKKIKTEEKR